MAGVRSTTYEFLAEGGQAKAEADSVARSFQGTSKAAQMSAAETGASLSRLEAAAVSSANMIKVFDAEIIATRRELALLNAKIVEASQAKNADAAAVRAMSTQYKELNATLRILNTEKALEVAESKAVAAAIATETAAVQAENAAKAAAVATETAAVASTNSFTEAFNKKTTRINVGRGALQGYDAALEGLVRAFGGVNLGIAIAIGLASTLLPKIIELVTATEKEVEINKELIATDIALADASQTLTERKERMRKVDNDLIGLLVEYQDQSRKLHGSITAEAKAREGLNKFNADQVQLAEEQIKKVNEISQLEYNTALAIVVAQGETSRAIKNTTAARQKDQDEIRATTDALVKFAAQTGRTSSEIVAIARSIYGESAALQNLIRDLDAGRLATEEFTIALKNLKIAKIDVSATSFGVESQQTQLAERIKGQRGAGFTTPDIASMNRAALQAYTKDIEDNVKMQAAANKQKMTTAQLQARVNAELAKGATDVNALAKVVYASGQVIENTAGRTRSGAAAARSYANALVDLTKRAAEAEFALKGDSFSVRDEKIRRDLDAERKHLEINKKDKQAALAAIDRIQAAQLEKSRLDRVEAERQVDLQITRMRVAMIQDERTRRQLEMRIDIEEFSRNLELRFGKTAEVADRIEAYRQIKELEFNRWWEVETKTAAIKQRQTREEEEKKFWENLRKIRLAEQRDARRDVEREFRDLLKHFQKGRLPVDTVEVEQLRQEMERLGVTMNDIEDVFGRASRDMFTFRKQLEAIAEFDNGNFLGGLITSLEAILNKFNLANIAANSFVNALSEAFHGAIVEGQNFVEVFGKTLLAGILSAIGQQAIAAGTFHILEGTAKLFNPLTAADGAKEIAAGVALVAFGSALTAAASALTASIKAPASGGGAASSSGGSPSSTNRPPPQPTLVPVPTTAPNPTNNVQANISLDRRASGDLLAGKEVVTVPAVRTIMRKKVQKAINGGKQARKY